MEVPFVVLRHSKRDFLKSCKDLSKKSATYQNQTFSELNLRVSNEKCVPCSIKTFLLLRFKRFELRLHFLENSVELLLGNRIVCSNVLSY